MGRCLFQLIGTFITLAVIGIIGYFVFTRLFQSSEEENKEFVVSDNANSGEELVTAKNDNKINASIKDVTIEHNVVNGGQKGVSISVDFVSNNLKNANLYCMVSFFNEDKTELKQRIFNENYRSVEGTVIVGSFLSPPTSSCSTKTVLFIPYGELLASGTGSTQMWLSASILYYRTDTDVVVLDISKYYPFYVEKL